MRFNPVADYDPGKTLIVTGTLSRSPLTSTCAVTDSVACYAASVVEVIPASTSKMDEIRMATAADTELLSVMKLVKRGHIGKVPLAARAYVQVKSELSEHDGLILRRSRIVMPRSMRDEILQKVHDWHRGLNKCRERACSTLLELQELAQQIDFQHCTSSPQHHQSNWHAEQALQTAKKILKQKDPVMALMVCRSTS